MSTPRRLIVSLALLLITTTTRAGDFFFHDGDRPIVFLGDSITQQRMYTTYIETYVLSRYPQWNVTFRNVGWNSDTSWLSQRGSFENGLKRDVLALKPMAITIDFGMNDARAGDVRYPLFCEYSARLVRELKAAGARVALLTPSPEERYEANEPGGSAYNKMLWKYSQALRQIAATQDVVFVDQYTPFIKAITDGRAASVLTTNPTAACLIPGGVHPNWAGHFVMASAILKGLDAPALVSAVELDAATDKLVTAEKCRVENIQTKGGTLSFRRTDDCLPWFIPEPGRLVLKILGFTAFDDLSQYELRVTNLTAPKYNLTIDNVEAGPFTKEELAAGVNLSLQAGPITAQAQKLFQAVINKNNLFFERWRNVQLFGAPALPAWLPTADIDTARQKELTKLDNELAAQEQAINQLRQPVPHDFKLTPVP